MKKFYRYLFTIAGSILIFQALSTFGSNACWSIGHQNETPDFMK